MKYTVIGAGMSGLAASLLAKDKGHEVFLTESKPLDSFKDVESTLIEAGIDYEFGANTEKCFLNTDCIITSPGVLPTTWIIQEAEKRGIKIISELEFASQFISNPIIAITGTNGKTTTTTLISYILEKAGKKVIACGNIGMPLSSLVDKVSIDTILVIEVSSFQLDRIENFCPDVAIILNITPDHLYYHGNMENYALAKFKISFNQNEKNLLILNADDAATLAISSQTKAKIEYFSVNQIVNGAYIKNDAMVVRYTEKHIEEEIMLIDDIRLPGIHNRYNSLAASLAARAFEVRNEDIRDSLMGFAGVEHRLEFVRTINGVDYINDSKATNVNATWYGLSSYNQPIIWIAGGRGDSNDYSNLDELVKKNVKCIVAIGEEQDAIFNHYCSMVRCIKADNLSNAVSSANEFADCGDVVVFTPACKSFDMFINYEHRGEVFKEIVNNL